MVTTGFTRICFSLSLTVAASDLLAQNVDLGRKAFESRCAQCHGGDGNGGEMGPPILGRLTTKSNPQLTSLIHDGIPKGGMPPNAAPEPEMTNLVKYLRTIQRRFDRPVVRMTAEMVDGTKLEGQVLGEGFEDVQLSTADKNVHLLRRVGSKFREVTSDVGWPTYNGDPRGNRYTELTQIDKSNVTHLAPRWVFTVPNAAQLQ